MYDLWHSCNTPEYRLCEQSRKYDNTDNTDNTQMKCRRLATTRTKFATYMDFNPQLNVHPMYTDHKLPEHQRIAATRFRLSSHNLLVEKLRWSRVPRHLRVCSCDDTSIQDEYHVVNTCSITQRLRENLDMELPKSLHSIFGENYNHDNKTICKYIL